MGSRSRDLLLPSLPVDLRKSDREESDVFGTTGFPFRQRCDPDAVEESGVVEITGFPFPHRCDPMRMKKGTTCLGPLAFLFVIAVTPMRMTLSGEQRNH